jgi:hypothetical protein
VLGGMKIAHYEEENGFVEASVNDAREKQKIHVSEYSCVVCYDAPWATT